MTARSRGDGSRLGAAEPYHQRQDDGQVQQVEAKPGGEGGRIEAELVIGDADL